MHSTLADIVEHFLRKVMLLAATNWLEYSASEHFVVRQSIVDTGDENCQLGLMS